MKDYTALIIQKWGSLPYFRKVGQEWKASCPVCGQSGHDPFDPSPPDRFHIHPPDWKMPIPRGCCRKCGHFETIEGIKITPLQQQQIKRHEIEHRRSVEASRQSRLKEIQQEAYWRGFHDAMTADQRKIWRTHGIDDPIQDLFMLGYNPDKPFKDAKGIISHSDALTIPYFRFINYERKPINIAHRLLRTDATMGGKYRYEYGVPPASFFVEPEKELSGKALVVEGAKKAIICWLFVGAYFDHIVGLPSSDISQEIADELKSFGEVNLFLDPDTYEPNRSGRIVAEECAIKIGNNTLLVRPSLYVKPDDFLLMFDDTQRASDLFMRIIDSATKLNMP